MTTDIQPFQRSYLRASTFVERAFGALERMHSGKADYRLSRGEKALLEEILPIAFFLRLFDRPHQRARCRHFGGNHPFDARMRVSGKLVTEGWLKEVYNIEVTSAVADNQYLKDEALVRTGSVWGGNRIWRIGSKKRGNDRIESQPDVEDGGALVQDTAMLVRKAIDDKIATEMKYPPPTILLVRATPDGIFSFGDWCEVARQADHPKSTSVFDRVLLVDTSHGLVIPI